MVWLIIAEGVRGPDRQAFQIAFLLAADGKT
jgi:hypothetical protein